MADWTIDELMAVELARTIPDGAVVHCGAYTPLVLASALLAQATHAPNIVILPISVSCARSVKPFPITLQFLEAMGLGDSTFYKMTDIFTHVEGIDGCDYEPISPVQIDRYGNFNMTVIGRYDKPKLRMPGAAGMDILPIMPRDTLVMYSARHSKQVFVPKVDFVTGAGFLDGPGAREKAGITGTGGPRLVVTNLGVMDFHPESKRMRLTAVHPNVTPTEVQAATGFELLMADRIATTPKPEAGILKILREQIDPLRIRQFEFLSAKERRKMIPELLEREEAAFLAPS